MRNQFIDVKTYYAAKKAAPWASKIIKVDGGYRAFESITDYCLFKNQK